MVARWARGYAEAATPKLSTDALEAAKQPPAGAVAAFRAFATAAGQVIPADGDDRLARNLAIALAYVVGSEKGAYRMRALLDPDVDAAVQALTRSAEILAVKKE